MADRHRVYCGHRSPQLGCGGCAILDGFYQATWAGVVAGFEVRGGQVTDETAPILKWARKKPALTLTQWVRSKGGQVELITPFEKLF